MAGNRSALYGRGKNSIYRREAPTRRSARAEATTFSNRGQSLRQRAEADSSRVLKRACCTRLRLGRHTSALFIGDSQLEALFDRLCVDRKVRHCTAPATTVTMVVAAGKWARYFPSFHTARIALAHLPSSQPPPTLIVTNMASPHLLHVHPVRPLLDVDASKVASGCYPQSTCADFHGLVGMEHWLAADVREFRQRLEKPTVVLMAPNWICDSKLYPAYTRRLSLPSAARLRPCLDWMQQRPARGHLAATRNLTAELICDAYTFSASGSDALSRRMEAAARSQGIGWLPATALTRDRCNMTGDARHYPGLVPDQVMHLLRLLS